MREQALGAWFYSVREKSSATGNGLSARELKKQDAQSDVDPAILASSPSM
jgi:hypothetical protein